MAEQVKTVINKVFQLDSHRTIAEFDPLWTPSLSGGSKPHSDRSSVSAARLRTQSQHVTGQSGSLT